MIFARRGIFAVVGRIGGENQLNEIAKRAQQGLKDIASDYCMRASLRDKFMTLASRPMEYVELGSMPRSFELRKCSTENV